jgi:glycerate kinase
MAACDVGNPLTGPHGAARVFSSQKGASPAEVEQLEEGLSRLAEIVQRELGITIGSIPHGGAGGGLGAGLAAFFNAELTSGFDLIAEVLQLADHISVADLVITGEGRIDASTLEGKVVGGVARRARAAAVDCVAVAGEISVDMGSAAEVLWLKQAVSLVDRFGRKRALAETAGCISLAVEELLA